MVYGIVLVATLICVLVLVWKLVSVNATNHIGDHVHVLGLRDHVVVGRHIIVVIWEKTLVCIVVIVNLIMYGVSNLQYLLRIINLVLRETKVEELCMIGDLKNS